MGERSRVYNDVAFDPYLGNGGSFRNPRQISTISDEARQLGVVLSRAIADQSEGSSEPMFT
jgi:hypothetical protein